MFTRHASLITFTSLVITLLGLVGALYIEVGSVSTDAHLSLQFLAQPSFYAYLLGLIFCIVIIRRIVRQQSVPLRATKILIAFAILTLIAFLYAPVIPYEIVQALTRSDNQVSAGFEPWNTYPYRQLGLLADIVVSLPSALIVAAIATAGLLSFRRKA